MKIPLLLLWRGWFYLLFLITILLMIPFLFVLTAKQSYYPALWKIIRIWAKILVYGMGFRLDIDYEQVIEKNKSYMFCPNHSSIIDPFVLILLSKNPIVFVGKKELVKIPIFGFFYKKTVIMVDRSSVSSKKRVFLMARERLKNGISMAIFPEGLVPNEEVVLSPFKRGAFSLAIEFKTTVVPQSYIDCKRLFSWDILKGGPGTLRIKQHRFINTDNLSIEHLDGLKEQVFKIIHSELSEDKLYMEDTDRKK
jgi:1-acyl-sn-glycerol-3-phosphate acyltransferase